MSLGLDFADLLSFTSFFVVKEEPHAGTVGELLEREVKVLEGHSVNSQFASFQESIKPHNPHLASLHHIQKIADSKVSDFAKLYPRIEKAVVKSTFPVCHAEKYQPLSELDKAGINDSYFIEENGQKLALLKSFSVDASEAKNAVAAYLIDAKNGGHGGVPMTFFTEVCEEDREKIGISPLEEEAKISYATAYVESNGTLLEASDAEFQKIPTDEVHKLLMFRARVRDIDGHNANMLYKEDADGVPHVRHIDLDLAFPSRARGVYSVLTKLPQARKPFSHETVQWIKSWNIEEDVEVLQKLGLSQRQQLIFAITSLIIQDACLYLPPVDLMLFLNDRDLRHVIDKCGKEGQVSPQNQEEIEALLQNMLLHKVAI